eukprot:COSAG02_NODE_60939_length_270_cov_0.561404_1_plen_49_part_10
MPPMARQGRASGWRTTLLSLLLGLGLLREAQGYFSVTPEGNLTLYGTTS